MTQTLTRWHTTQRGVAAGGDTAIAVGDTPASSVASGTGRGEV
jgi:hypothetical protein